MRIAWTGITLFLLSALAMAQEWKRGEASSSNLLDWKLPAIFAGDEEDRESERGQVQPVKPPESGQGKQEKGQGPREVIIQERPLKEESLRGEYKQPEWTFHRRLPSTRVYVQQPPGTIEFEQWVEVRIPKDTAAKDEKVRLRQEFEFGLGHRLQLDLYMLEVYTKPATGTPSSHFGSTFAWRGWSAELRYALADWDVIPGNPTLYFEYILLNGEPAVIEPKILFGGELAERWHWGLNLILEKRLAGYNDMDTEWAVHGGVSYTLVDQVLGVGGAFEASYEVERESKVLQGRTREVLIGPSFQFRPTYNSHLDLEPLFGVTGESKRLKFYIVFGWDF